MKQPSELESSYDRVAGHYAAEYFDELSRKPFDRELLDRFAVSVSGAREVCEIGYLQVAGFSDAEVIEREPYEFE